MKRRSLTRGATLPIVLILSAMMLVTASAWLQTSLVAGRATVATRERAQAFHAGGQRADPMQPYAVPRAAIGEPVAQGRTVPMVRRHRSRDRLPPRSRRSRCGRTRAARGNV